MQHWTRAVVGAAGGIAGGTAAAVAVSGFLWDRSTARAVRRLVLGRSASEAGRFSLEQLAGLPKPVVRYFEFALTAGQPLIQYARAKQTGEFRMGGLDTPWRPLTAIEHFSVDPPGFVWDASIRVAPLLTVRVRDSYVGGTGSMQARIASLVTVMDQWGRLELNSGALHRYLAEAVSFPTALLPGPGMAWEAIDDTTARAILTDAGSKVSMEFQFDESGAIVRAFTPERYREVEGQYIPTPWACSYRSYAQVKSMRVPIEAEVEWILPEGRLSIWRGRSVPVEYPFER
jgi:hypothetical protein